MQIRANCNNDDRRSLERLNKDAKPWVSVKWDNFFAGNIETFGTKIKTQI